MRALTGNRAAPLWLGGFGLKFLPGAGLPEPSPETISA
jgi:hypothetical protein